METNNTPVNENFAEWQARMDAEGIVIEGSVAVAFSQAKAKAQRDARSAARQAEAEARHAERMSTPEGRKAEAAMAKAMNGPTRNGFAANH